ncbi:hypothetical protein GCM10008171_23550 [Methylopila jiangsuensis]|uniref:DUF4112 domain-containing protein n=1 Tax=Methylopila jiangsuensis TaxID=586230 RepID=A0A9W6JGC6_9HYPH|nr:DUF4112 domain-containing protein [Methylopila jiangsuensis]MDR6286559.1 hypothetical protein [Methylopila jiangsuensis]GLK77101.1 hypothetical protein GCM10008171_23550 [Methylopila jiangsuensis]
MTAYAASGFAGRMARPDHAAVLDDLERLATLLDSRWRIPGTNWRFGLDAAVGLAPGVGDLAMGLVSAYMIKRASDLGAPGHVLARMVGNVALDTVVGSIPLLGSVFDVAFKANRRNMRLLRRHFGN